MEYFERAHVVTSKSLKNRKLTENKKKLLKQMLHGYKVSDNKLIQQYADLQNDYEDSTSVSGFSDLNLTISSQNDETNPKFTVNKGRSSSSNSSQEYNTASIVPNENSEAKICNDDTITGCTNSFESNDSEHLSDKVNASSQSSKTSESYSCEDKHYLSDESISESNGSIKSMSSNDFSSEDYMDESDSQSDSETSIVMTGLNLTESDVTESFDADGELAARIQEKLQKTKIKQKYTEIDDSNGSPKGPITTERCERIQLKEEKVLLSDNDFSTNSNILNNDDSNSIFSLPYVSITASDMQTQKLDDIIGEYRHSTMKNLPSEIHNTVFSTNNSGFFIEEDMIVDIQTEDEVGSLIPELDDIPQLEEIDDEIINLDTTTESLDRNVNKGDTGCEPEILSEDQSVDYDSVADMYRLYYGSNCCIIILKHPCELFIQGKVKIRCLGGTVELFGYTLKNDSSNVYVPYYNIAQSITTVENENVYYGLFGKLTASGLSVAEAEEITTSVAQHDGVILLEELKNKAFEFVEHTFKVTNLFYKSNKSIEPLFSKASDKLNCSIFSTRPYKSFHEHPSWSECAVFAKTPYSRGIVCGGKGAGKSTYLRYQVNKLLAHGPVLVVDLDPGQSAFTVAGGVSATVVTSPLFGPSFTHLRKPELMLNIGMINTMDNAKLYASAVQTVIKYCRNNDAFSTMPWLINTMGMTNALGLKFITLIITLSEPTYLLQYESKVEKQRFETLLTAPSVRELFEEYKSDSLFENVSMNEDLEYAFVVAHDTDSPQKSIFNLTPRDERYLNFLAYFSEMLVIYREASLLSITPYEVSMKDLFIATNVTVKEDHIAKVINGKLVALCQQEAQYDGARVFTLTDKPLLCRGHGLIRGIDWEKEILYVITPLVGSELSCVDTLLYADWVPELVGYEKELPMGTKVPYRIIKAEQHKQLMSTPRRRFNPLQLLKMSRNT